MAKASMTVWPRMLSLSQAATYCGISVSKFKLLCPVRPVSVDLRFARTTRTQPSRQMLRYDRVAVDQWLDGLEAPLQDNAEGTDFWLQRGREAGVI